MTYMNDRRRVELALVPSLYAMWVRGAMDLMHRAGKSRQAVGLAVERDRLVKAAAEPLDDLRGRKRGKLMERLERIASAVMDDVSARPDDPTGGANMTRVFLQLAILTNQLADEGHIAIVAGGNFEQAYEALKDGILSTADRDAEVAGLLEAVDKSATKGAARMRAVLDREGLFQARKVPA